MSDERIRISVVALLVTVLCGTFAYVLPEVDVASTSASLETDDFDKKIKDLIQRVKDIPGMQDKLDAVIKELSNENDNQDLKIVPQRVLRAMDRLLKGPFLNLLASISPIDQATFMRRIKEVEEALDNLKRNYLQDIIIDSNDDASTGDAGIGRTMDVTVTTQAPTEASADGADEGASDLLIDDSANDKDLADDEIDSIDSGDANPASNANSMINTTENGAIGESNKNDDTIAAEATISIDSSSVAMPTVVSNSSDEAASVVSSNTSTVETVAPVEQMPVAPGLSISTVAQTEAPVNTTTVEESDNNDITMGSDDATTAGVIESSATAPGLSVSTVAQNEVPSDIALVGASDNDDKTMDIDNTVAPEVAMPAVAVQAVADTSDIALEDSVNQPEPVVSEESAANNTTPVFGGIPMMPTETAEVPAAG